MWRRSKNLFAEEHVTVTVDEVSAKATLDAIETARVDALNEVGAARRKLEAVIAEAKTERGKLNTAVATARRKGQVRS